MYYSRLRYERLPWLLDLGDKVGSTTFGHRLRAVCWERRTKCSLRGLHWQRHLQAVRKVQEECIKNSGNTECLRSRWSSSSFWKSHWRGLILTGRNVVLLPFEDDVEELFLRLSCYRCSSSYESFPDRPASHVSGPLRSFLALFRGCILHDHRHIRRPLWSFCHQVELESTSVSKKVSCQVRCT